MTTLPPTLEVRYAPIPTFEWNFPCFKGDSKMIFEQRGDFIMILRNNIQPFMIQAHSFMPNLSLKAVKLFFALIFGAILILDNCTDTKLMIPGNT